MTLSGISSGLSNPNTTNVQDRAQKLLKQMDTDSDGKVSKQEFAAFGEKMKAHRARGAHGGDAAASASANAPAPPSADDMFAKADTDGDGSLSIENLSAMISEHETHAAARGGEGHGGAHGAGGGHGHGGGAGGAADSLASDPADTDHDGVVSDAEKLVYQLAHSSVADTGEA